MKKSVLSVAATALALLVEAWVMRLCGVKKWGDILGCIVASVVIPAVFVPRVVLRKWFGCVFGESSGSEPNEKRERSADATSGNPSGEHQTQRNAERTFLHFMSALAAKIAKADGHVDAREIAAVERAFEKLGLSESKRRFCIEVFRSHVSSETTISSLARQITEASLSAEIKALIYEILWSVSCADGVLTKGEKEALRLVSTILGLNSYERYYRQRVHRSNDRARSERQEQSHRSVQMTLGDAYEILGCRASSTDAEIKASYREIAKKSHPDVLRAQGLPDEMVDVATRKMAEINAAWQMVKSNRRL